MKKLSLFLVFILLLTLLAACQTDAPATTERATEKSVASTAQTPDPSQTDEDAVHPMLFHVTGQNGEEGYLFGTIHAGDARIQIALKKLLPYLDSCDALAVEFDLVAYEKDFAAQMKAMQQFVLTDGTTVEDHMPKELYEKAAALLKEAKLQPNLMKAYNLAMWAQLVEQGALMVHTDYDLEAGMDRSLIEHCYEKNIEVRDVESAELQYQLLAGFPDELNLMLLQDTLNRLDTYGDSIANLFNTWVTGDYAEITSVLTAEEEMEGATEEELALMEDYYDKMLTQRNLGMRDKAVQWLKAGDKVFFAVGTAHLVNEDGLIALLRSEGYTVEQVDY